MLLLRCLINSPYNNYCSHIKFSPAQNVFARLATRWRANKAVPLLNQQQIKVCSLRLIRLLLSRCDGSGGHLPVHVSTLQTVCCDRPLSFSVVPVHQQHTGRVNAGQTESAGGGGEGCAAAPHCDGADSMAD